MTEDIWCPICETSDMLDTHYKYASDGEPFWECLRCLTQFDYEVFNRIKDWKEKAEKWDAVYDLTGHVEPKHIAADLKTLRLQAESAVSKLEAVRMWRKSIELNRWTGDPEVWDGIGAKFLEPLSKKLLELEKILEGTE